VESIRTIRKVVEKRIEELRLHGLEHRASRNEVFVESSNLRRELQLAEEKIKDYDMAMQLLDDLGAPKIEVADRRGQAEQVRDKLSLSGRIRRLYIDARSKPVQLIPKQKVRHPLRRDKPRTKR
jgi:hypothetical protein